MTESQLEALCAMKKKSIATCRPGALNDEKRMALLKLAMDSGVGYIDIEYEAPEQYRKELVGYAREKNVVVILSYHNFEGTPDKHELEHIIGQSLSMGADRVKLATFANSKSDNSRILSLYETHSNLIAFCMGQIGTITRVAAPFLGSEFTYAAISKTLATAPGQLTSDDFLEIYDILRE